MLCALCAVKRQDATIAFHQVQIRFPGISTVPLWPLWLVFGDYSLGLSLFGRQHLTWLLQGLDATEAPNHRARSTVTPSLARARPEAMPERRSEDLVMPRIRKPNRFLLFGSCESPDSRS